MSYFTGWIPDEPDPRDWLYGDSKVAISRPITGSISTDWRSHDARRFQGSNSCVGHGFAASAFIGMSILGLPIRMPEPLTIYSGARMLQWPKLPLRNIGCSARFAALWIRDNGIVPEGLWPELEENIDQVPPLDVLQAGQEATVEAFYRIEEDARLAENMIESLRRGHIPCRAQIADEGWKDTTENQIYDQTTGNKGFPIGGHYEAVVGYVESLDLFIVRSTWPVHESGYVLQSRRSMQARAKDVYIVQAAPNI